MNIWSWVQKKQDELIEKGENRLSEIMSNISSFTCDDHHDQVDMIYQEGLSSARRIGDKWVEIFLRHWHLQSQVLHRKNAKGTLDEAIDLLDFSHQEDTKGCPQRICAVQDLANCYGIADGPGYVAERIEVADETLNQINGSWPCYACVATEKVSALIDAEMYEEALHCLESAVSEMQKYEETSRGASDVALTKTRVLIALGRLDEAERVITTAGNEGGGESFLRYKKLFSSLVQAHKGNFEQSIRECLPYSEVILSPGYFDDWCQIQYMAALNDSIDIDSQLLNRILLLASKQKENGAIRISIKLYDRLATLALKNGAFFSARIALKEIENLIPLLNQDLGASENLEILKNKYFCSNALVTNDSDLGELDEFLIKSFEDKEQEAIELELAHTRWPQSGVIVERLSDLYAEFQQANEGLNLIKKYIEQNNNDSELKLHFGHYLLSHFSTDLFFSELAENSIEITNDSIPLKVKWLFARAHHNNNNLSQSKDYLEQCLNLSPASIRVLSKLATAQSELHEHENALLTYNQLIELEPDEQSHHWDRIVVATIIERWNLVRESAEKLNMKISGTEGVVLEDWEPVRIQFATGLSGQPEIFRAKRTGPVTARITEIMTIGETQRYGTEVVFNPAPLNELDQQDVDGNNCDSEGYYTHRYLQVHTIIQQEWFTFALDGFHPGVLFLEQLQQELNKFESILYQRSGDDYILEVEEEEGNSKSYPGYYAYILTPRNIDPSAIHRILSKHSANLELPLIWPGLLEQVGDIETLEAQQFLQEKYEIY